MSADPPNPIPDYLWPQRGILGPEDLRLVPSTAELRAIVKLLDTHHLAGFTMLTMREGSPWLEIDVAVPGLHPEAREYTEGEVSDPAPHGTYRYALWRYTGKVYRVGADGAVEDDPINLDE